MKSPFKIVLAAAAVFVITLLVMGQRAAKAAPAKFQREWIAKFQAYTGNGEVPSDWKEDVYLRKLSNGEWVLAAMHHGACAPGPRGHFNASVILDSRGRISSTRWAPCASGITEIGQYWEVLHPANKLEDIYDKREWGTVAAADRRTKQ